jgi:hypothetical protein
VTDEAQGVLFYNDPAVMLASANIAEATNEHQLGVLLEVKLKRLPRGRCTACGNRRVLYALDVAGVKQGVPLCAKDAGIR